MVNKGPNEDDGDGFDDLDRYAIAALFATKGIQELSEHLENSDDFNQSIQDNEENSSKNEVLSKVQSRPVIVAGTILMAAIMATRFIMSDPKPEAILGVVAFIAFFGVLYVMFQNTD